MKVLITGVCGFVGSSIARFLIGSRESVQIIGIDNLARRGSETNFIALAKMGVDVRHGDLRVSSDLETIPHVDWVIDAAALPSVLAGVDGSSSSAQLVGNNLGGTMELLEFCKRHRAGLVLLSTSRVYSIESLTSLPLWASGDRFEIDESIDLPVGVSPDGIDETFSTSAPVSLYGATKIASEVMALEYGSAFDFPVVVNRCGVLAGAGQFGRADQGIFSFWLHSHRNRQPLKYIGFGGHGHQVRDCLHVRDLAHLVEIQIRTATSSSVAPIVHVSGGIDRSVSLNQLTAWCDDRFGKHEVASSDSTRPFDLPWVVLNNSKAAEVWDWQPKTSLQTTLEEIATHADENPDWLELSR